MDANLSGLSQALVLCSSKARLRAKQKKANETVCLCERVNVFFPGLSTGLWHVQPGGEEAGLQGPLVSASHPLRCAGKSQGDRPALCCSHGPVYNPV